MVGSGGGGKRGLGEGQLSLPLKRPILGLIYMLGHDSDIILNDVCDFSGKNPFSRDYIRGRKGTNS